ncbi:helix-turn-helix transcriptional regulator [Rhodovulum euryhalinum]|uniref:Regulatory LuxR family protein n=1 Tax=Rhodovulum euryhalinum TaxID=35805 RepID=A0A4R2L443_9RHOB|nr:LuxR family transcriptional regulator [Rhodovulum euryhalinum]TCO73895.1 regulatory LuxR family protein [Rhodovulum euryhalinum]
MKDVLESFLDRLQQATTLEHLQLATEDLRDHYGVSHVVYHWVNSVGERYGAGTYSTDWVDRYLECDYLRMDPVILGCFQRFHPVDWKQLDWTTRSARAFFADAVAHGLGNQGFSVPIHGPKGQFALFTMNHACPDTEWEAFIATHKRDLILVAHDFNRKALEFERGTNPVPTAALSPRELAAMTLLAKGLSRAQAAEQLDISEHTLRVYIEAARHKLGALNTTHAVARALSAGLIVL